jgi:long-chain acyl-CoA synthetase
MTLVKDAEPDTQQHKARPNRRFGLEQLYAALRNNTVNYLEFYGRGNEYLKKTYSEIYTDVLKVITMLKRCGLKPGDRIGILGANSYAYVLVDLAAVMGGYVSVPFPDRDFPERIGSLHVEYNLKLLFAESKYAGAWPKDDVVDLEVLQEEMAGMPAEEGEEHIPDDEDIFMVIFTSGTTGFPKGIEVRSKCLDEWIAVLLERFAFTATDKVLDFLPLSISNARLFIYAAILLPFNLTVTLSDQMMRVLQLAKPTILQGVPYLFETVYGNVMRAINASLARRAAFHTFRRMKKLLPAKLTSTLQSRMFGQALQFWGGHMRLLVTGSAPISTKVIALFEDMGLPIYESYGINEIGLVSINSPAQYKAGTVGKPFPTKEVVIGEGGEILIRSDYSWGTGYLNDAAEADTGTFRSDGFVRTGDTGYLDRDGYLHIIGRIKEIMVLANGEKIHPNLIEERLKMSTSIKQAVAVGNDKPFITCVIVPSEQDIPEPLIREALASANKQLPQAFHIRNYIIAREAFTTENGLMNATLKVNRNKVYEAYHKELNSLYE